MQLYQVTMKIGLKIEENNMEKHLIIKIAKLDFLEVITTIFALSNESLRELTRPFTSFDRYVDFMTRKTTIP